MAKLKDLAKCKHPNSRRSLALTKQTKRLSHRKKIKLSQNVKQNLIAEKIAWFKDNLSENNDAVCSIEEIESLVIRYLSRFNDELEQIKIKHSIGNRKNRQHASREDIINMTIQRETEEFNTCGLEMPDLLNVQQMELLKTWNGELRYLTNFKLRRFSKKYLESEKFKQ